jgi:uncharacterized membrane protein (UPF0182 family)
MPYTVRPNRHAASVQQASTSARIRGAGWLWWVVAAIVLLVFILPAILAEQLTDWMWFSSQGLGAVYTTRLALGWGVFFAGTIFATLFLWANWTVARRIVLPRTIYPGQIDVSSWRLPRRLISAVAVVMGLFMGLTVASEWPTILLFLNSVPFGQTDPLFGNDTGFYVFGLPFYRLVRGWFLIVVVLAAIGTGAIYLFATTGSISRRLQDTRQRAQGRSFALNSIFNLPGAAGVHLSILGAAFLLLIAFGYWLDRFGLLYSIRAFAYGAGYTDVHAKLPALNIMMVVAALMAVLLVVNTRVRTWKLLVGAVGVWLAALILVGGLYPAMVQNFVVRPSEYSLEKPYIEYNIAATRRAFGLDQFQEREVPAVSDLTPAMVSANQNTIENIRLWDYRPLLDTYATLQEIRTYYSFVGVDIDRYMLEGRQRQVMVSARELSSDELVQLGPQVGTWQNLHFVYTHGYGAVVSPVNEIVGEGLPRLLVRDIPPHSDLPELQITRPEIYYGELTNEYVFVNSAAQEFDYPFGDTNKYVEGGYQGRGGVGLGGFLTKLLFALRFGDGNILLTNYITPQTRVLFHRNIHDMVDLLAPFLSYDKDPYLVISDGRLYWIQDAYTTSDRYPYSSPVDTRFGALNYIRNPVKVVIDAYNGTATYYVTDPSDPIIQAYRRIFPALFHDMAEMPSGLRAHVRYPEEMFNIQAHMYATFHMTDPQVFYTKEDVWNVPLGTHTETSEPLEAYYVNIQLPGESKQGFMLILPFTPATKDNMIAWMAAKSDGQDYGKVTVIRYPKQQLVYGPSQIEARINQDPIISQQITLWNQSGSQVRRGNLLVVPISDTVLYVEPLFLQAQTTTRSFPELKRVIVATINGVGMGADLKSALDVALKLRSAELPADTGTRPPPATPTPLPGQTPQPAGTPPARTVADLTRSALAHYDSAQEALRRGDWATYGQEMQAMKADLDELARLTGAVTPTPVFTTTPGPGTSPGPQPTGTPTP